nr:reverse transcriptase domain-containing protein [Tanacetum cinerariifolium]
VTKDTVNPTNNRNTKDVQPQAVQSESPVLIFEPVTCPISEPAIALKLPEKLGNPGKFLIPCDFPDFDVDPRVPLILGRSFLKTERALIDVSEDQTSRYSANYSEMSAKRIDVIDMACEEYSQEVLGDDKLPVIIAKDLSVEEKTARITVLKSHKRAIAWKLSDIKEDFEQAVQHQRRINPKIHDVIKQEVIKLLDAGLIYPISDSPGVSPVHCVPKKGGFTVVEKEDNELIPTRLVTGTFQRCMMAIFHDMIEKTIEVFMDDFFVFGNSFQSCLSYLQRMLRRCKDTNLCLNWEKSYFMVKEGIVLDHKISKQGIEVDKAKVDVITKLSHPTTIKGIRSFLGHAGFYHCFIKDFSKIARPMTRLLEKDTPFIFSQECVDAFQTLKRKLTEAPILIAPDWDMPFELMCDASDFAIGVVLGQHQDKHFRPIHYASKTMAEAESNYTTTEKEMLAVEFTFKVIDTKGAENLAADHLSRLENPHHNVLDPKKINESFPLETLNLDDPNSPKLDPSYYDQEGDIQMLKAILNSDPAHSLPNHEQSVPSFTNELKACEAKTIKSSVDEPPEVELKDLPPHLEYVFLEGDNKFPVIIAKELGEEEKAALIKVLKSHKRAIAWKLSDIQGINPKFCTHKILMEEDYKLTVQHQRRVNPKIHDVIKKEVEKLLDAGLIYPISDSPWVSLVEVKRSHPQRPLPSSVYGPNARATSRE